MAEKDRRDEFLIALYNQLMNDINRHIIVVWQSVATLIGAFAAYGLVQQKLIPLDLAAAITLGACIWHLAHVYDASYWYNRNLVIIANIERQFLRQSDLKEIHYYFGKHRPVGSMISHLKIQYMFGAVIGVLVLVYHFVHVILPLKSVAELSFLNVMPIAIAILGVLFLWRSAERNEQKYREFLRNSPGAEIATVGVEYGVGHGFDGRQDS